jgi:hypothetical protein
LKLKFGTWEIEWGTINRFQRPNGDINLQYNDAKVFTRHLDQLWKFTRHKATIKTVVKNAMAVMEIALFAQLNLGQK